MDLEEYVYSLIDDCPAVGYTQIDDLVDLAEGFSKDQYNKYEIVKMIVDHMQKYYGFST